MQNDFLLSLTDLTSLNDDDSLETIGVLCEKAITPVAHVAAVCVYPVWVAHATSLLNNTAVKIATVVNFPHGTDETQKIIATIHEAIAHGATEIDLVFPYLQFMQGQKSLAYSLIQQCKAACGENHLLKVILETGAFSDAELLAEACDVAVAAGADFLKTSTGKISVGATLEAATILLQAIQKSTRSVGLKISGGIRTIEQANQYIELANKLMGPHWVSPRTFRVGASRLLV